MAIRGVSSVSPATEPAPEAPLAERHDHSDRAADADDRELHADAVAALRWRAGQHVDVRLTAEDGYQAQRSYSIASAHAKSGALELAIERMHDGEVSAYFHEVARVGDVVELRGPIGGRFIWENRGRRADPAARRRLRRWCR